MGKRENEIECREKGKGKAPDLKSEASICEADRRKVPRPDGVPPLATDAARLAASEFAAQVRL